MTELPSTPTLSSELKALFEERNMLTQRTKSKVINALESQMKEEKDLKARELKTRAIEEIFTSEVSYLNSLEIAMKFFKQPLFSSKFILPEDLKSLFEALESVYNVNGELLNQLRAHEDNIASAFTQVAPFFKLYSVYAYNYRRGLASLQVISKDNMKLKAFIKQQETRPEVCMKLESLLIAPIQRMPRYRLLLKELLSRTPESHPHYESVAEAIKEVEDVTEHINSLVSDQENVERIIVLQKSLVGGRPVLVCPGRKLIKEGVLNKVSRNGKNVYPRYFLLMTDLMIYCKMTGAVFGEANSLRCCNVLPLDKCTIEEVSDKQFSVLCNGIKLRLYSDDHSVTLSWFAAIRNRIQENQRDQSTLKRGASVRTPLKKRQTSHISESFTPRKRKQNNMDDVCSLFHSPWKRKKIHDSSKENSLPSEEIALKRRGHLSSFKKVVSDLGHSLQYHWSSYSNRHPEQRLHR